MSLVFIEIKETESKTKLQDWASDGGRIRLVITFTSVENHPKLAEGVKFQSAPIFFGT